MWDIIAALAQRQQDDLKRRQKQAAQRNARERQAHETDMREGSRLKEAYMRDAIREAMTRSAQAQGKDPYELYGMQKPKKTEELQSEEEKKRSRAAYGILGSGPVPTGNPYRDPGY